MVFWYYGVWYYGCLVLWYLVLWYLLCGIWSCGIWSCGFWSCGVWFCGVWFCGVWFLGAVHLSFFRLTLITPRRRPNRPTRKRTTFPQETHTFPQETYTFPQETNVLQQERNDGPHKTLGKQHEEKDTTRTQSADASPHHPIICSIEIVRPGRGLVRSHFSIKAMSNQNEMENDALRTNGYALPHWSKEMSDWEEDWCAALRGRSVRPRPKWKMTRCELTVALCHTGQNVIVRSTFTLRLACVKRRREKTPSKSRGLTRPIVEKIGLKTTTIRMRYFNSPRL